jgi:hypothetical protein
MIPTVADLKARYGGEWAEAGPNFTSKWASSFEVDLLIFHNPMSLYRFGAVIRVDAVKIVAINGQTWTETLDKMFQKFHKKIFILPDGRAKDEP